MNIQTEYIKSILPKYYAGESTIDEDRILREYFLEEDVDPELATDKATFMALFSDTTAPESLRLEIEKEIDRRTVKASPLRPHRSRSCHTGSGRKRFGALLRHRHIRSANIA